MRRSRQLDVDTKMSCKSLLLFTVIVFCAYVCYGDEECLPNSKAVFCGSICEPTCRNPRERLCKIDPSYCKTDCRCSKGFVRNEKTSECVRVDDCDVDGAISTVNIGYD